LDAGQEPHVEEHTQDSMTRNSTTTNSSAPESTKQE